MCRLSSKNEAACKHIAARCAPHSFFSSCRKERMRRARWKKEKGARGLQSFEHRRPRGVAYALALLRSMSIPPYFHSKRLSFPGESRGNPKGARKPRLVVSIRVGPGRGKGTSPPPVADEGLMPFPQRSKNARKSVSPQHFSGTARWEKTKSLHLAAFAIPGPASRRPANTPGCPLLPLCGNSPCGAAAEIAALLLLPPAAQGRNSPPWCRFLCYLSFGQQKKGTSPTRS